MTRAENSRFDSWKEIAAYLQRDVRTVRRWEKERALPVHRVPGGGRAAVYAYPNEIDEWLRSVSGPPTTGPHAPSDSPQALDIQSAPTIDSISASEHAKVHGPATLVSGRLRGRRLTIVGLLGLIFAALLVAWALHARGGRDVGAVTFSGQQLLAWSNGKVVWSYDFGRPVRDLLPEEVRDKVRIESLDGDGGKEIVVAAPLLLESEGQETVTTDGLYCFSPAGKLLWRHEFHDRVRFGGEDSGQQWEVAKLFVTKEGTTKTIWCNVCSYPKSVSVLMKVDATGHVTPYFVNFGHMRPISEVITSKGRFIVTGGVNNANDSAALVVLSESMTSGHSPGTGSLAVCEGCPSGEPIRYVLFPRSEVNLVLGPAYNWVKAISAAGGGFEAMTGEEFVSPGGNLADWALYSFSPEFAPLGVTLSDNYWDDHRRLSAEGKIGHTVEDCPERLKPITIRVWNDQEGWSNVKLPPITRVAKRNN